MRRLLAPLCVFAVACAAPEGSGLALTREGTGARVKFDVFHRPLPEIPLPNDFASRFDATSFTKKRVNASQVAPTEWESKTRRAARRARRLGHARADHRLFRRRALDTENIIRRHHGDRFDTSDDVILVIDVTKGSPDFCKAAPLDLGEGHFPARLDRPEYYPDDPRGRAAEPHLRRGGGGPQRQRRARPRRRHRHGRRARSPQHPQQDRPDAASPSTSARRSTLIARPIYPLREATTYAVVLTKNLRRHRRASRCARPSSTSTTPRRPGRCSRWPTSAWPGSGYEVDDVAFSWSFTTQAWTRPMVAVRDGLYGLGPLARLATEFPAEMVLRDARTHAPGRLHAHRAQQHSSSTWPRACTPSSARATRRRRQNLFFDNFGFIDFHAVGTIDSPQFFPRFEDDGMTQKKLTDQVWQLDAETGAAFTRHEGVNYWLMVPKNRTGPAPVAIFIHGHGSTKFDAMNVAGFLARMGIATLGIDAVSHGVDVDPVLLEVVKGQFKQRGIEGLGIGIVDGRALDQNNDGKLDSGVDYWTAYLFHTRDVVRQTAVDLFQVIRVLKSFDGVEDVEVRRQPGRQARSRRRLRRRRQGGRRRFGAHPSGGRLAGRHPQQLRGRTRARRSTPSSPSSAAAGWRTSAPAARSRGVRDAMVLRMMAPLVLLRDGVVYEAVPDLINYVELKVGTLTTTPEARQHRGAQEPRLRGVALRRGCSPTASCAWPCPATRATGSSSRSTRASCPPESARAACPRASRWSGVSTFASEREVPGVT